MQVEKVWVIRAGNKFIAEDQSSGGYPYETTFWNARKYDSLKSAWQYAQCSEGVKDKWQIYECDEIAVSYIRTIEQADPYEIELAALKLKYGK